jgi:hypothetical protein
MSTDAELALRDLRVLAGTMVDRLGDSAVAGETDRRLDVLATEVRSAVPLADIGRAAAMGLLATATRWDDLAGPAAQAAASLVAWFDAEAVTRAEVDALRHETAGGPGGVEDWEDAVVAEAAVAEDAEAVADAEGIGAPIYPPDAR